MQMIRRLLILIVVVLSGIYNLYAQTLDNMKYRPAFADGYDRSGVNFKLTIQVPESVCQYDSVKFTAVVKGTEEYMYKWWKEGEEDNILSKSRVLLISSVAYADKGKYICQVTDIFRHSTKQAEAVLNVSKTPTATIVSPQGRDTVLCLNDEIILRGVASLEGVTLKWNSNKGFTSTIANTKIKVTQDADYIFTADNHGCLTADTLTIRVNKPCVSIPSVVNTTEGSTVNVIAKTCDGVPIEASALVWYKGATNLGQHNPLKLQNVKSDMTISVIYTSGSCWATDTLQFRTKGTIAFVGGEDDGYTGNCIPPILLEQKGVMHETCAVLGDDTELRIIAEGTGIEYQWQKFNTYTYEFEPVAAPAGVTIEGMNTDVLRFSSLTDAASGRYRCVLNGCGEEVITDTFNLSVSGAPIIVSGLNTEREHCLEEGYADFNVVAVAGNQTGNLEYRWFKDGVQISSESDIHSNHYRVMLENTSANGIYKVIVSNQCGKAADSAQLIVLNPPVIAGHNDSVKVCRGGDAEFWVNMQEAGNYTYTLYRVEVKDPISLDCEIKETIAQGPVNRAVVTGVQNAGTYRWRIDHPYCGYTWSKVLYLRVEEKPVITSESSDTILCAGEPLVLQCLAAVPGFNTLQYQWYKNGELLTGQKRSELSFSSVKAGDAGIYECEVYNSCPAERGRKMIVKIKDKPVWTKISGAMLPEYCEGDTVTGLEVRIAPAQDVDSVRWFKGYNPVFEERMEGANSTVLRINGVTTAEHNVGFFLRMYNSCGYTDSYNQSASLPHFDVREPAHFVKGLDGSVNMTLCYGMDTTLCVKVKGTPKIRYSWLMNGDTVAVGDVPCLPVDPTRLDMTQKYTCHIHNACGSEISEANIKVIRQPLFDLSGGGHYCEGAEGLDIVLSGSDSSCIYRLVNTETGQVVDVVDGADVRPLFGQIRFANKKAGKFQVIGVDTNRCEQPMNNSVDIVEDPLPEKYNLLIDRHPCGTELTGDFKLSGNEALTAYHLLNYNGSDWVELNVSYSGGLGEVKMPGMGLGIYKVKAIHLLSGCERIFDDSVNLIQRPFPDRCRLDYLNQDSVYCRDSESEVGLEYEGSCFKTTDYYQLQKEGTVSRPVKNTLPLKWTGLEEGAYRVEVTNQWGCKIESALKTVYRKELPLAYHLTGDTLYCDGETVDKQIRLTHSETGVNYRFYYLPGNIYKDTIGQGGEINLDIPCTERSYYVIATDSVDGCQRMMEDTVHFRKHGLKVKADSSLLTIHAGDAVQLNITIEGAAGVPRIEWNNEAFLADPETEEDPVTLPLMASRVFKVTVEDGYCSAEAEIEINVIGGDLSGEIRKDDCSTACDSVRICRGETVGLCGMASGGGGDYRYSWSTETGLIEGATDKSLREYLPLQSGYLYWQVNSYNETVKDSVWVTVDKKAGTDTIIGPALRCVLPGDSVGIVLLHTEAEANYMLQYSTDGVNFADLDTLGGTAGTLTFVIKDAADLPGFFRIRAEIVAADGKNACETLMKGNIEVRQAPRRFTVSGQWEYCEGDVPLGNIIVDSTEMGVDYRLCSESLLLQSVLQGTGDTLKFSERFHAGIYYVMAERGQCRDTMNGEAVVVMHLLPQPGELIGSGTHCTSDGAVTIGVSNAEANKEYVLQVDSVGGGREEKVFYGEGELLFGLYEQPADYSLTVRDTLTGCMVKKEKISIRKSPGELKVEGEGVVCYGQSVTDLKIKIYPADPEVQYTLYRVPSIPVAVFTTFSGDSLFYEGALPVGEYVVKAAIGSCERWYADTVKVSYGKEIPLPVLTGKRLACEGDSVELAIRSSEIGYIYTFSVPDGNEVKHVGDGYSYLFGKYGLPGIYTLRVEDVAEGCIRVHDSVYRIEKSPQEFMLLGGGIYCSADSMGRTLTLSGSDSLMPYFIERKQDEGWLQVGDFMGNGKALSLPGSYGEGIYRVVAGSICHKEMSREAIVEPLRYPDGSIHLTREGNGCADSTVKLSILTGLSGYTYALYRNDTLLSGTEQSGNDRKLEWVLAPASKGIYRVKTEIGGCLVSINDSVQIGVIPALERLRGDSVICHDAFALLYVLNPQTGVNYELYNYPADTLFREGDFVNNRIEYAGVTAGQFYVRALNGDCEAEGRLFKVIKLDEVEKADWELSDCVMRDSGRILLKKLEAEKSYFIEGDDISFRLTGHSGDTLLTHLPVGVYQITVRDTLYGCRSEILKDTIREGVYQDSLVYPLAYCEVAGGKQLEMSGVHLDIRYSILDSLGGELMSVTYPDKYFPFMLTEGKYRFRKQRNEPGGCVEDREFHIVKEKQPLTEIAVSLQGASPVCEGKTYQVELEKTEEAVTYYLYHLERGKYIDTLIGQGRNSALQFGVLLNETGKYRIYASGAWETCSNRLDTTLEIHARPVLPRTESCNYCYQTGEMPEGCGIALGGMSAGIRYIMYNTSTIDTIEGIGTGLFKKHTAGIYQLVAQNKSTGCTDTASVEITGSLYPKVYRVEGGCDTLGGISSVVLEQSEKDSVVYQLYKDGVYTNRSLSGTGAELTFTGINMPGVYRIRAQKLGKDCGIFMEDSVALYRPLQLCGNRITVEGSFCENVPKGGVTLSYPCSVSGWKYYVTNGVFNSNVISGGGRLTWSTIGEAYIREGEYELYAENICGEKILVANVVVEALKAPENIELENTDINYCAGQEFDMVLKTSERDVNYRVLRYSLDYDLLETGPWYKGNENRLLLGQYAAAGYYEVWAKTPGGCEKRIADLTIPVGRLPQLQAITGRDVCVGAGASGLITVGVPQREAGVAYYLYLNETQLVDSLTSAWQSGSKDFAPQVHLGCYSVMAQVEDAGCKQKMIGTYCMNTAPVAQNLIVYNDTVNLCIGSEACFEIDENEAGIHYVLVRNGVEEIVSVPGTTAAGVLDVGCTSEEGIYRVKGVVGECSTWMNDSVYVRLMDLPVLDVVDRYRFCAGTAGIRVRVNAPTFVDQEYYVFADEGDYNDSRMGDSSGDAFEFDRYISEPGIYYVGTADEYCESEVRVEVVRDKGPKALSLYPLDGNYICEGGSVQLGLQGTKEEDVTYELYRWGETEVVSTLKDMVFRKKITSPGTYYVLARLDTGLYCETAFGAVELKKADTLKRFALERVKNAYCETDISGGIIRLNGSEEGVKYELLCDERPTGMILFGNGAPLEWTGVKGKPCSGSASEWDGYVYRVIAYDTVSGCSKNMLGSDTIVEASWSAIVGKELADLNPCQGERVQLSVTANGCANTYAWYQNGVLVKRGHQPYYNIEGLMASDEGSYYCQVFNVCGDTVHSNTISVEMRKAVVVERSMEDVRLCDGVVHDVTLSAGFGGSIRNYSWYKAEKPEEILGTNSYLKIAEVSETNAGKYVCKAESGNNCGFMTDTAEIFIGTAPQLSYTERTDTLCAGSDYFAPQLSVANADSIRWLLNGENLAYSGNAYKIHGIAKTDEGIYSVRTYSHKCGDLLHKVSILWIDDTLRVIDSDTLITGCVGTSEFLTVELSSDDRVKYTWEKGGEILGHDRSFLAGPFVENTVENYRVWFRNACTSPAVKSYQDVVVQVPKSIVFNEEMIRQVILCADCTSDTLLEVEVAPASLAQVKWYFHKYTEANQVYTGAEGNSIRITDCTQNSGYYQGVAYNRCQERVASPDIWVRIDSIPVVLTALENDTVCPNGMVHLGLTATGGGLTYRWYTLRRNGQLDSVDVYKVSYFSSAELTLPRVDYSYDSCRIWCKLLNHCGEAVSDTMFLSVNKQLEVMFSSDTIVYCEGTSAYISVELLNGTLPWSYYYRTPSGLEMAVQGITDTADTLWLSEGGFYQLVYVADSLNCVRKEADHLPGFYASELERSSLSFSGGGERCLGDTVSIQIHIEGGVGPWEITITDGENEALNICGVYPLILTSRDTSLVFIAEDSASYHVSRGVYDQGSGCWGHSVDNVVDVIVHDPGHIEFIPGPWHIGACQNVNLKNYLRPQLQGHLCTSGRFYINGSAWGTDHLWLSSHRKADTCYTVSYGYQDEFGCSVSSDNIQVWVDGLPSGAVVTPGDASCQSVASDFELQLRPAGRIDSVIIRQARYKKWDSIVNPLVHPSYTSLCYGKSYLPADGLVRIPLTWGDVGGVDSCLTFEVLDIWDIHGCRMSHSLPVSVYDSLYRDTIWRHLDPVVDVEVRLSESRPWSSGVHEVNLASGDSVQVKVTLTKGEPLWKLDGLGIDSISGMDTVFWLKGQGTYYFIPRDLSCDRQGPSPWYDLKLTYLDTGYFRGRLWLEGPYDESNGRMSWGSCNTGRLADSLNLPSSLPLLPSGLDVIDWVEVELRVSNGSPLDSVAVMSDSSFFVTRDSCLVLSDGHLADRWSGDTVVGIRNAYGSGSNKRYVVVRHRNHLGVMTNKLYSFVNKENRNGASNVDFTNGGTIYCRDGELKRHMTKKSLLGKDIWLLSAGELNRNKLITLFDPNHMMLKELDPTHQSVIQVGYRYDLLYDINLDGCVDWPGWNGNGDDSADWNIVKRNRQKHSEIR